MDLGTTYRCPSLSFRRYFLYPIPVSSQTIDDVVASLPDLDDFGFGWDRIDGFVVAVESVTAAIYLRAFFAHRPADKNGDPLLEDHEIWIEDERRQECETMLRENCPSPAQWFEVVRVSFADDTDHRAFGEAYSRITGLPNAFSRPSARAPDDKCPRPIETPR